MAVDLNGSDAHALDQIGGSKRKVGGVYFSFSKTDTDLATGKVLERATITQITMNPDLDAIIFDRL